MYPRVPGLRLLRDRRDAGERLAARLGHLHEADPVVLGLPRGGVPVAFEIARRLRAPLDVFIVRKIGAPGNPEYGLGAVAEDGTRFLDLPRAREAGYSLRDLEPVISQELEEIRRRAERYRRGQSSLDIRDRTAILVDDGVATGGTLRAAIRAVRKRQPRRVVVALGVAPPEAIALLEREADEVVVELVPPTFFAVGEWYTHFDQVSDDEVEEILRGRPTAPPPSA